MYILWYTNSVVESSRCGCFTTSIARFSSRKDIAVKNNSKVYSPEQLVKLLQKAHIAQQSLHVWSEIAGIGCEVVYNPQNRTVVVEAPLPVMTNDMEPQEPIMREYIGIQSYSNNIPKIIRDIAVAIDADWREYDEMINREVDAMIAEEYTEYTWTKVIA